MTTSDSGVDAVVSYVDPSAPGWGELKDSYTPDSTRDLQGLHKCRYRKNAPLRMQLELIRKNMGFIRTIYVVCPSRSHCDAEDLTGLGDIRIVEDGDIVPHEYMPVFNSHAVELFMHRIAGLSEKFVYFNDDMYVASEVRESDFVSKKGVMLLTVTPRSDPRVRRKHGSADPESSNEYSMCAESSVKLAWTLYGGSEPPGMFYWLDHAPFMFFKKDNEEALRKLASVRDMDDLVTRFRDLRRNIAVPQYYSFYSAFKRGWKMRSPDDFWYVAFHRSGSIVKVMSARKKRIKFICANDSGGTDRYDDLAISGFRDDLVDALSWIRDEYRNDTPSSVPWGSMFDRIFCLHYVGHADRLPGLLDELGRVGISDSGVFEMRNVVNDPYETFVEKSHRKLATLPEQNRAYTSILLNYSRILRESIALGYRRILVLEDDVRFLRDVSELSTVFRMTPDCDVVQYDKHLADPYWDKHDYSTWVTDHMVNDLYFKPDGKWFGSSACVSFTQRGMKDVLRYMDETYNCPDSSFRACASYVAAHRQPAIQVMYDNGAIAKLYGYNKHSETYSRQGIDMNDYNIPEGYGDGVYDPGAGPSKKGHDMKICVYAITKNEEKFVDKWVDSMSEADEIYVLDTGSTDGTVEKLRRRGVHVDARTYDPWRFDTPRNDAMAMCPADTDVYVSTDLDEVFVPGWRDKLESSWKPGTTVLRYDYVWGWTSDGKPDRKFRYEKIHGPGYEWRYPVHELLFRKDGAPNSYSDSDILLEHHPDPSKSRGSYLGLLELSVREDPSNARNVHYLAREHTFRRNWDEAIKWHMSYLKMNGWAPERAASMRYLAECHHATGNDDMAELWVRRAMDECPSQREAAFWYAGILVAEKRWRDAARLLVKMFKESGTTPPNNYVTVLSAWGPRAYDYLGMSLWYSGDREMARSVYSAARSRYPDDRQLSRNLELCGTPSSGLLSDIGLA